MAAEKWTRERRRELTRTALLDAAAEAFAQRGFHGASLDEIAEAAGYTRGAITFNFGSKEELLLAVVQRHNDALTQAYAAVLEKGGPGNPPALEEISAVWQQFEAGDRQAMMLMLEMRLYALRNPAAHHKVAAFEQLTEEAIGRFVADQAAAAGSHLKVPADELAAILYAATYGLQQHVAVCPKDHERLFEQFLQLVTASAIEETGPKARPRRRARQSSAS